MVYAVGTKVEFLHTGEKGVITAILDHEMVNVLLIDDDIEIPANLEDLMLPSSQKTTVNSPSAPRPRIKQAPQRKPAMQKKAVPASSPVRQTSGPIAGKPYLYLGFDDLINKEGVVFGYALHLINNTSYTLVYQYNFDFLGKTEDKGNGSLPSNSNVLLTKMHHTQLNDSPVFHINCQPWTTSGKEKWSKKDLKVKAKQFFKKIEIAPQLNRRVHLFELFTRFDPPESAGLSLKEYTESTQVKEEKPQGLYDNLLVEIKDLDRIANFPTSIDLHIENLVDDHRTMSNQEISSLQMRRFVAYIEEAILHGISPVYIVHGKGEGRLRDKIRYKLNEYPEILEIDAGFHAGYGDGGATKVFLKK